MLVVCIAVVVFECMQQSGKFKSGGRPGMWQTGAKGNELWVTACALICTHVCFVCADATSSRCEWKAKTCHTWQGWNERKWLAVFWCHGLWAVLIRNSHTLLSHLNSLLSTALPIPSVVYSSLCPLAFLSVCVWLWFHVCGTFSACHSRFESPVVL